MSALERLAQAYGVALRYHDIFGALHEVPQETLRTLLAAMDVDASSDAAAEAALARLEERRWRRPLPPLVVLSEARRPGRVELHVPAHTPLRDAALTFELEDGSSREAPLSADVVATGALDGEPWRRCELTIDVDLPLGYHRLSVHRGDEEVASTLCAVAPARCYRPERLRDGGRTFGTAVQLYGLRSRRNWGIGDFTDLGDLVEALGRRGAGIVGVNPLHALFPHNPAHASPYSPSSRLFVNVMYVDVEAIDDFAASEAARSLVASPAFTDRVHALREAPLVDYAGVAAVKRQALELVFATFRERTRGDPAHAAAFEAFRREGGESLQRQALFDALQEHFHAKDASVWGWPAWPAPYRDPDAPAVARFALEHQDRVDFYAWLQWQADVQRARVAERARKAGLAVGLYTDLAVSIDRGGAESWANQALYATGASVGAPPDAFNTQGQDWGLPPIVPSRLVAAGYGPLLQTLRANMRHAGALRIDHVMGLMRLFWVPPGGKPAQGAYIGYPFADMLSLLALESVRHRCLVIGEDLGTVPDDVRTALAAHDVLSYRVLLFERDREGRFNAPAGYPEAALATASTHDLPALAGWWEGRDIDTRASLGLVGDVDRERRQRGEDRAHLLRALKACGALPDDASTSAEDWPAFTPALAMAVVTFLGSTASALAVVQLEDLLLAREQANLPGTVDEHPNWRRKLPLPVDGLAADPVLASLVARLAELRPAHVSSVKRSE